MNSILPTRHATSANGATLHPFEMVVQQHVLNWLYSILTSVSKKRTFAAIWQRVQSLESQTVTANPSSSSSPRSQEYHDVNRTYNDVAQALSQYPSLTPRTDVHSTAFRHGDER